jgi:hypothetical protein
MAGLRRAYSSVKKAVADSFVWCCKRLARRRRIVPGRGAASPGGRVPAQILCSA